MPAWRIRTNCETTMTSFLSARTTCRSKTAHWAHAINWAAIIVTSGLFAHRWRWQVDWTWIKVGWIRALDAKRGLSEGGPPDLCERRPAPELLSAWFVPQTSGSWPRRHSRSQVRARSINQSLEFTWNGRRAGWAPGQMSYSDEQKQRSIVG